MRTKKPRSLAELPEGSTLDDLRRAWEEQDGIRLLNSEKCRYRGRREEWEIWEYTPRRPPAKGPKRSYIVVTWQPSGLETGIFFTRGEAEQHLRHRGVFPGALFPPLHR